MVNEFPFIFREEIQGVSSNAIHLQRFGCYQFMLIVYFNDTETVVGREAYSRK